VFRGLLFCFAFAWGCDDEQTRPVARADAGKDASSLETGASGTGGVPTVPPASGGSTSEAAAPLCPKVVASLPDSALAGSACDGGRPAQNDEAGTPPPHCVAPCVWELIKNCRPTGRCVTQEYPTPNVGLPKHLFAAGTSCAAENDWWDVYSGTTTVSPGGSHDVYLGACPCYRFTKTATDNGLTGIVPWNVRWYDGAGRVVADGWGYPRSRVLCGPWETLARPEDAWLPDGGGYAPGFTPYDMDPTTPDCAGWLSPTCEPGCCSGNPPKLPRETITLE
jgi:hypothetical protein